MITGIYLEKIFGNKILDILSHSEVQQSGGRWEKFLEEKFLWKGKFDRGGYDLNPK